MPKFLLAALLLVAIGLVYFLVGAPPTEPVPQGAEPTATEVEEVQPATTLSAASATELLQRDAIEPSSLQEEEHAEAGTYLRVLLEGISVEDAQASIIQLFGVDADGRRMKALHRTWNSQGESNLLPLDGFLAEAAESVEAGAPPAKLEVSVDHDLLLLARTRIAMDDGIAQADGSVIYEARLRMIAPEFWDEFTLSIRDADTRAHLKDVELHCVPTSFMGIWRQPGMDFPYQFIGEELASPLVMMGGHEPEEPEDRVAGLALYPKAGESMRFLEFESNIRVQSKRGILLYARAPGYAWGSIVLDFSTGADRELLLGPSAGVDVQLENVQLPKYEALEEVAVLSVYRHDEDGGRGIVRFAEVDPVLEAEGMQLEGMVPGDYSASVDLGASWWGEKRPVLAYEEFTLAAGEQREVVLALNEPPPPAVTAPLGGVLSLPEFGGEEDIRLEFYHEDNTAFRDPDVSLALTELTRVGGDLPTWSFRVEDLPVGSYRLQLLPLMPNWVVDLPAGGRTDLELGVPELAFVEVETVDGMSGERVAIEDFYFRSEAPVVGRERNDWVRAEKVAPGSFRFWTMPGTVTIWSRNQGELGYGLAWERHELVAGSQAVRFELPPLYAMDFEFREGDAVLPIGPQGMHVQKDIRAVDHHGEVTGDGLQTDMRVEVSAPGLYEIDFDRVTGEAYRPIPRRLVQVQAGEVLKVVVDLVRK